MSMNAALKALHIIEEFRKIDTDSSRLSAGQIATFLCVASNEGVTLSEIADTLGYSGSLVSKTLKKLWGTDGHGWVERRGDPEYYNEGNWFLTTKGRAVVRSLEAYLK